MKRFAVSVVILCLVLTPVFAFASSKTIRIESNPEGATIHMDGQKVGVTPLSITVDNIYWYESNNKHEFKAEKAGYTSSIQTVQPSETNVQKVLCAVVCVIPWLWVVEPPDVVKFTLYPVVK